MARRSSRQSTSPHGTQAWLAVVRAYNLCDAVMTSRLAPLGLRIVEHEVLATLATVPGITQQALAERCFVAKSGVSMLLAQMETKGWVTRQADLADARVKRPELTPAGRALAEKSLRIQAELVETMVAGSSADELERVTQLMERVSAQLVDSSAPRRVRSA